MSGFEVACVGVVCLDFLFQAPRVPRVDEKVRAHALRLQPGGQAATAAAALARWGVRTQFLGAVGDDEAGRLCLQTLAAHGVDVKGCVAVPGVPTHQASVVADPQGHRTIVYHRAAELGRVALPRPAAEWVHLDAQDLPQALAAAGHGGAVSLDLEEPPERLAELIARCDVVVADGPAGRHLAEAPPEAARLLAGMGPRLAGVTLGPRGAVGWCEGETLRATPPAVEVVDSTGAGDLFHAGVVLGCLRGWPAARTWRFAVTAAALSCRVLGGMPGIPDLDEVLRTMEG